MLRQRPARAALLHALSDCERLVLLGDLLELRHGPLRDALGAAQPVLEEIGATLGPGREVVIVPGNHDHGLLRPWLGRRAAQGAPGELGLEAAVDWREREPLAAVAAWLGRCEVRASYPGTWIRPDVYATHGHYCDRHITVPILERLGAGVMARIVGERGGGAACAEDYEATLGPMYAWIDAVAQNGGVAGRGGGTLQVRVWRALAAPDSRRTVRAAGLALLFPALVGGLNRAGLGPLRPNLSGVELRRAGLKAFAEVLARLGVSAGHVIFGHTHRAGPLPGDDRSEWIADGGAALLNSGSWVHESRFLSPAPGRSPYRPGFCAIVGAEGEPELVNVLDDPGAG